MNNLNVIIPYIFKSFPNVLAAQSTRCGGVSPFPFDSLNMGFSSGDKEENVLRNRELFYSSLGITSEQVAWSGQVHGKEILFADRGGKNSGYDALITNCKNVFTAVGIADCCPVLIYDAENEAVAAIHAGWKGTVLQIVNETMKKMNEKFGTLAENCYAYIGTCISECSFEVESDVADKFENEFVREDETPGKYYVDLKRANLKQLREFGIPESHIEISGSCTILQNEKYFSYRKEGKESGRMLAIIGMKE